MARGSGRELTTDIELCSLRGDKIDAGLLSYLVEAGEADEGGGEAFMATTCCGNGNGDGDDEVDVDCPLGAMPFDCRMRSGAGCKDCEAAEAEAERRPAVSIAAEDGGAG
jgi:hypothetical protein